MAIKTTRPFLSEPPTRRTVGRCVATSIAATILFPLSLASHADAKAATSQGVLGELDAVTVMANGVLAVGAKSFYATIPFCGQVFSERSVAGGWQTQYAVNRGNRSCAWRTAVTADRHGGAWAVGYYFNNGLPNTLTEHFNGLSWSVVPSPSPGKESLLNSVTVAPNGAIWAVGEYQQPDQGLRIGAIKTLAMVNNGSGWHVIPTPSPSNATNAALNSITVGPSGHLWAVGFYRDNQELSDHTLVMTYGGASWQTVSSPSPGADMYAAGSRLKGVVADGHGGLWAVGSFIDNSNRTKTLTMHYAAGSWQVVSSPSPGRGYATLSAVAATPGGTIWAAGSFTGRRCGRTLTEKNTGGSWLIVHSPNPSCNSTHANALYGLAVDRRGTVYAVGTTDITTLILANNGATWHVLAR